MRRFVGVAVFLWAACPLDAEALREAAEALDRGDFAGAIPHLEAALEDEPDNVNARFNLAYALQSTTDEAGAIHHYRVIAERQPDLVPARQNLATLLMRAGEFADAAREFQAVARARPDDQSVLLLLAAAHREAGNHDAAAAAFRVVLERDGSSLDAVVGLAQALDASGRLHEAIPHYLRAAAIDPQLEELLPAIAARLEKAGARQDAIELYRRYARARPGDAAAQEEVGILLLEDGNPRSAAQALERSLAAEPTPRRHAALAEAYRQTGDTEAAFEQLRLAARSAPGNAELRVRYASALLQRGQYDGAAREYLAACEADPTHQAAWTGLGFAMFQAENFAASLRAIVEAERLGALRPATVYLKALGLDKLGQYEPARAAYRQFLAMRPELADEAWKAEQRLKAIEKVLAKR